MARMSGRVGRFERRSRPAGPPVGIHVAAGMVAVVGALMLAALLPASAGGWRLVPVAAMVLVVAAYTVDLVAVALVTLLTYPLVIGFLVNQFGVLSWHGREDLYRLAAVVGAAGCGLAMGSVRRRAAQAGVAGAHDRLGTAGDLKLAEDVRDVVSDGVHRNAGPGRDGGFADTIRYQPEHLRFPRGQSGERRLLRARR